MYTRRRTCSAVFRLRIPALPDSIENLLLLLYNNSKTKHKRDPTSGGTVLKKLIPILTFILAFSISVCALAAPYADQAYRYNIELPEEETTYYYTQESSNMPEDLLSVAQGKTPPVCFLIASYENGTTLSYSLDMTATPVSEVLPSLTAGAAVTDLSMLSAEQLDSIAQEKKTEYGSVYTFDADTTETLAGKTALVLTGRHADDNGYTTKIYLLADNNNLFVITMLYKNDVSNAFLAPAEAILSTLRFDSTPVAVQPPATSTVTPAPAATASATPTPAPQPTAAPTSGGIQQFLQNIGQQITNAYYNDPYFPLYVAGACVVAALIVIIIVLIRASRKRDITYNAAEGFIEIKPDTADSAPAESANDSLPETVEVIRESESNYDLSNYTRPPRGYDVGNPITRPTIAEESLARRNAPAEKASGSAPGQPAAPVENAPRPVQDPSRPKVGSRVERYRNQYKKKK